MRSMFTFLGFAVCFSALLTGCGGLSSSKIEDAIEDSFGDDGVCWALKDMASASFPIRTGFDPLSKQSNAILEGLIKLGFIEVARQEVSNNPYGFFSQQQLVIDLTPSGQDAKVWDAQSGFCIGHKRVVEVTRFSDPTDQSGVQVSQAEYKWAIEDTPAWFEPTAFSSIGGVGEPVEDAVLLQKMSDGWRVVGAEY